MVKVESGHWKDWEVSIQTLEGVSLPEHNIQHTPPTDTSPGIIKLFLECEHDKTFCIAVDRPKPAKFAAHIEIKIDGDKIHGMVLPKTDREAVRKYRLEEINGVVYPKSLKFQQTTLVENGPQAGGDGLGALATINVKVTAGDSSRTSRVSAPHHGHISKAPQGVLDERSKKGLVGSFVGGDILKVATKRHGSGTKFDKRNDVPQYIFDISYATRDLLRAQGIITEPRRSTTIADDSDDVKRSALKTSGSDSDEIVEVKRPKRKSKMEKVKQKSSKRRKQDNTVIDMTGDDD